MNKAALEFIAGALALTAGCATLTAPAAPEKGTIDPSSKKACHHCHPSKVTGPHVHQALAEMECTPCHTVRPGNHQKDHDLFAVKDKSAKLCWECHDSPSNPKSVHPVIEAEGCTGCHLPHTSRLPRLLKEEVPALCFDCHDRKMVQQRETAKGTEFRDGLQNLHYLHVMTNAIPCLTCHDVHASSLPHLIRPKGSKGKEDVTTTYVTADRGGNCTTSCHDQLGYERK